MIELKGYKVNKLEIENKVKPGTQLKLQNQLKYNVNYLDDNKTCIGIMELRVADADLNPFEIKIEMVAKEVTRWLKVLVTLSEGLGSVPSIHTVFSS